MLFRTTNHRVLLPGVSLCGALLALVAGLFLVTIPLNAVLSIIGVPVILGKNGIEKIVELDLNADEKAKFKASAESVRGNVSALKDLKLV